MKVAVSWKYTRGRQGTGTGFRCRNQMENDYLEDQEEEKGGID
jgi:hypothetical protein